MEGAIYTIKVSYIGRVTVTVQKSVQEYDLYMYIPIARELSTEKIKAKRTYIFILPIPILGLTPLIDPKEPVAHTPIKLSTVQAYIEEKMGLLLRMRFINTETKSLIRSQTRIRNKSRFIGQSGKTWRRTRDNTTYSSNYCAHNSSCYNDNFYHRRQKDISNYKNMRSGNSLCSTL